MIKKALATVTLVSLLTLSIACTKSQLTTNANIVLGSMTAVLPLVQQYFPGAAVTDTQEVIQSATGLVAAIQAGNTGTAAATLQTILGPFVNLQDSDLPGIVSGSVRADVTSLIAAANSAIEVLASLLQTASPAAAAMAARGKYPPISCKQFLSRPDWSKNYLPKK